MQNVRLEELKKRRLTITSTAGARRWLLEKLTDVHTNGLDQVEPGKMTIFHYDPKTKDKLPYYDTLPLIFLMDYNDTGFTGINLHYIPPSMRAILLNKLLDLASDKRFDKDTCLRMNYDLLNSTQRYKEFKPCFKRYLWSHMRSKFVNVLPWEWDIAIFLPTANFEKMGPGTVWNDSKDMIG